MLVFLDIGPCTLNGLQYSVNKLLHPLGNQKTHLTDSIALFALNCGDLEPNSQCPQGMPVFDLFLHENLNIQQQLPSSLPVFTLSAGLGTLPSTPSGALTGKSHILTILLVVLFFHLAFIYSVFIACKILNTHNWHHLELLG